MRLCLGPLVAVSRASVPLEASRINTTTSQVLQAAIQLPDSEPSDSSASDDDDAAAAATQVLAGSSADSKPVTAHDEAITDAARRKALLTAYGSVADSVADDPREAAAASRQAAEREAAARESMITDRLKVPFTLPGFEGRGTAERAASGRIDARSEKEKQAESGGQARLGSVAAWRTRTRTLT